MPSGWTPVASRRLTHRRRIQNAIAKPSSVAAKGAIHTMRLKPSALGAPRITSPYWDTRAPTISFLLFPALIPFSTVACIAFPVSHVQPLSTSPQLHGQMIWLVIS